MKRVLMVLGLALLTFSNMVAAQQSKPATTPAPAKAPMSAPATGDQTEEPKKKRPPVFRANKEQIKQAQEMLKQRNFYAGEATGKLDPDTRAGLKKFLDAVGIKVTGTLNAPTLEKMKIALTGKQKEVLAKQKAMKEGAM